VRIWHRGLVILMSLTRCVSGDRLNVDTSIESVGAADYRMSVSCATFPKNGSQDW
jgi:hypothetical protein